MDADELCVSCYSARLLVDYARKNGLDVDSFLIHLDILYHKLMEPNEWMSVFDWLKLVRYIETNVMKTAEEIAYEIVMANKQLTFRLWLVLLVPLYMIKKFGIVEKVVHDYVNKNIRMRMVDLSRSHMLLAVSVAQKSLYSKEICGYNRGAIKALMELKGYQNIKLEEQQCATISGDSCLYRVSWYGKDKAKGMVSAKKAMNGISKNGKMPDFNSDMASSIPVSEKDIEQLFKEDKDE